MPRHGGDGALSSPFTPSPLGGLSRLVVEHNTRRDATPRCLALPMPIRRDEADISAVARR